MDSMREGQGTHKHFVEEDAKGPPINGLGVSLAL